MHNLLEISLFLANLATAIGVAMIVIAFITFRRNISIKRKELIDKIYGRFLEKDFYEFYIRVCNQDPIDLQPGKEDERLLNKSLTLLDEVNYFMTQKFLDKKAWEYIASEIQNFSHNEKVWGYICQFMEKYIKKGFPEDIIPFTGFPELVEKLPPKFRANPYPGVPDRYKTLLKKEAVDIMNTGKICQKLFLNQSAAWVVAAFTLVLVVVAVLSYCNYKKTNEISVSTQRAFVQFKSIQGVNVTDIKGQELLGLQFFVELENSGTTPTKSAFAQSNVQPWRTPLPKGFGFEDLGKTEKHSRVIIGAKQTILSGPLVVDMDTINDAIQKKSFLFFWGWVIYHDIFSDTRTRLTEFCYQLELHKVLGNPDKPIGWTVTPWVEHNCSMRTALITKVESGHLNRVCHFPDFVFLLYPAIILSHGNPQHISLISF